MEIVKVYSPIEDKKIRENLGNSPIFKGERYHESEVEEARKKHNVLYEYRFKFNGTKLVQFNGIKKV